MPESQPKRKLAAIVSADVVGYSRLMGQDEHATVHRLTAYRAVFANLITLHGGRVADTAGDSALAEFGSVVELAWPGRNAQLRETCALLGSDVDTDAALTEQVDQEVEGVHEFVCPSGAAPVLEKRLDALERVVPAIRGG